MQQLGFTDCEYANRRRITKRETFLRAMDGMIPWAEWVAIVAPFYHNNVRGRKAIRLETILRMYLLQNWFNLSDEGVEDAIYDSYAMKSFLGVDFLKEQVPDATTLLHFRHLLEGNGLQDTIFSAVRERLDQAGLLMHGGTIVDATIVEAPSSTKNARKERDEEMHSTKKGNQWHFGMKVHAGVDAGTGYVHTITATAANAHDITEAANLIRDDDHTVYGDSGYLGLDKREEIRSDLHKAGINYQLNARPSQNRLAGKYQGENWDKQIEHNKASVRCKVEHIFHVVKDIFGVRKTRYRGLAKNRGMFAILFASANLFLCWRSGREREFALCKG